MHSVVTLPDEELTIQTPNHWSSCGCAIPELHFMFDMPVNCEFLPEFVAITHTHVGHCWDLPLHITSQTHVFIPHENQKAITAYIQAMSPEQLSPIIHGVRAGQTFPLKNEMQLEVFDLYHGVPCRGYGISRAHSRLKPEFQGLTRNEIIQLKKQGGQLTEIRREPLIAYLCDTSIHVLEHTPVIWEYPYLMLECTYLPIDPSSEEHATAEKHIHWSQLSPWIQSHPETTFLICHVSSSYSEDQVRQFVHDVTLPNVKFCGDVY
jgi:ribonuclease Z|uniref:Metallo-beta-lactamase domain-containing protein n=1 Tax=viral metagenome TaxID=1070528 RepID=A0A6C0BJ31_9ZZZZ